MSATIITTPAFTEHLLGARCLNVTGVLWVRCNCPHFTDKNGKAQRPHSKHQSQVLHSQVPAPSTALDSLHPIFSAAPPPPRVRGFLDCLVQLTCHQQHPQKESSRLWAPEGKGLVLHPSLTLGKSFPSPSLRKSGWLPGGGGASRWTSGPTGSGMQRTLGKGLRSVFLV